jgi:hypothetical protein
MAEWSAIRKQRTSNLERYLKLLWKTSAAIGKIASCGDGRRLRRSRFLYDVNHEEEELGELGELGEMPEEVVCTTRDFVIDAGGLIVKRSSERVSTPASDVVKGPEITRIHIGPN